MPRPGLAIEGGIVDSHTQIGFGLVPFDEKPAAAAR